MRASRVAAALEVERSAVPVESYYVEDPQLTEYFLLMRTLQDVGEERTPHKTTIPHLNDQL